MQSIFISYSSRDRFLAWRLEGDLQLGGGLTWLDAAKIQRFDDEPDPAHDDEYVISKLMPAIEAVDWFVVLVPPAASASRWVELETNAAFDCSCKTVALDLQTEEGSSKRSFDYRLRLVASDYDDGVSALCSILGLRPPSAQLGPLGGIWTYRASEFASGSAVIIDRGNEVAARIDYETGNSGQLIGVVHGRVLRFVWWNSLEHGIGCLELVDATTLRGFFVRKGSTDEDPWTLHKVRDF